MNLTTYLMSQPLFVDALERLHLNERMHPARVLTDQEMHHWGFAEERPWDDGAGLHFDVIHTERVLPNLIVNLKLYERLHQLEAEGAAITKARRKEEKEALLTKLIAEAPQRTTRIPVYLRRQGGMVMVGSAKAAEAEAVLKLLRKELGSFPAVPMADCMDCLDKLDFLTEALLQHNGQDSVAATFPLIVDDRVTLVLPGKAKATARFTGLSLACEEVTECLRNGMRVKKLGVRAEEAIEAEVDEHLVLTRFEVTDVDEDRMDEEIDRWGDSARSLRVIRFAEAAKLLDALAKWLEVEQPLAPEKKAA